MTAPLSHYLTRFSAPPAVMEAVPDAPAAAAEPLVMLTPSELEAKIDAARQDAVASLEACRAAEIATMAAAHETSVADRLAAARAEWTSAEGARLAVLVEQAMTELRDLVCARTVAVLRPWLAEAAATRAKAQLGEAFGRLLAHPKSPCLRVCGPAGLVSAMRETLPDAAIEWSVTEAVDVTVITDATRIETQLASALADLVTES